MCNFLDDEASLQTASSKPNTTTMDTKLQQILKTLLIDVSFVAMVRNNLSTEFLHTCHVLFVMSGFFVDTIKFTFNINI